MFRHAFLILIIPMTGACVSVVSIDIDDSVSFRNIEASFPLSDGNPGRIRIRGSDVNGELNQFVDSSERIQIDDTIIFGPTDVGGEINLTYFSIAYSWDKIDGELYPGAVRTSFYIGLARTYFDLIVENAGTAFQTDDDTTELYLQYGLYNAVSNSLEIGLTWALSIGRDLSGINEIDLKLDYEFFKQLKITGGYRWFDYAYGLKEGESNIEVDFRGPFIGLNMPF